VVGLVPVIDLREPDELVAAAVDRACREVERKGLAAGHDVVDLLYRKSG
jgi:hypothetical protein